MFDRKVRREGLITELAASFIRNEANSDPLITITNVNLSPDLRKAVIFFTTIPDGREEDALIFLKRNSTNFRDYLKKKAGMKHIPHVIFMYDAGEKHRQHMDELLKEVSKK